MVRALVVGFGSIGQRHARLLDELGHEVAVVSRRSIAHHNQFSNLADAVRDFEPAYVVIANRTSEHLGSVKDLVEAGFRGRLLVEKPLFSRLGPFPENRFHSVHLGYHLRFHPLLQELKTALHGEDLCSFQAYVGQYLPDWRPGTDYRDSYSAHNRLGGGVLFDLSHELDFTLWLLDGWTAIAARGGTFSALEIDSDDCFCMLLETPMCPAATVQVNYLDRKTRREIIVNTKAATFKVDVINGTFEKNQDRVTHHLERDTPYVDMHRSILDGDSKTACTVKDGMEVMHLMDAARRAAVSDKWIKR